MNEKINLPELIALLSEKAGISKKEAEVFIKECFLSVEEGLIEDKIAKIKNLGTFKLVLTKDRESIDVTTGNRSLIPAHYKVNFTPDKDLSEKINEPFAFFPVEEVNNDELAEEISLQENEIEDDENVEEINNEEDSNNEIIAGNIKGSEIQENPIEETKKETKQYYFKTPAEEAEERKNRKRKKILIGCLIFIVLFSIGLAGIMYIPLKRNSGPLPRQEVKTRASVEAAKQKRAAIIEAERQKRAKEDSLAQSNTAPKAVEKKPVPPKQSAPEGKTTVKKRVVQPQERLTTIALEEYGNKQFWVYIYEENKAIISNPDRIKIGLELVIPPASKYKINANDPESVQKAKEIEDRIKFR